MKPRLAPGQPHRALVQLDLAVGEIRHLLEGVHGDQHGPDVGLGSRSRAMCPFPCPHSQGPTPPRRLEGGYVVPATSCELQQEWHEGFQLGTGRAAL